MGSLRWIWSVFYMGIISISPSTSTKSSMTASSLSDASVENSFSFREIVPFEAWRPQKPENMAQETRGWEYDVDYYSNDVQKMGEVADAYECEKLCERHAMCKFWSYGAPLINTKKCYLKLSDAGREKKSGYISGKKRSPTFHSCYHKGVFVDGYDVPIGKIGKAKSPQECRKACETIDGCYFFQFNIKNDECELKTADALIHWGTGKRENGSRGSDWLFGPKNCQRDWCLSQQVQFDLESNSPYLLNSYSNIKNGIHCQKLCSFHQECTYFMYDITTQLCTLLNAEDRKLLKPIQSNNHLTGPRSCGVPGICKKKGKFPENIGYDLGYINHVDNEFLCQVACYFEDDCYFWTFHNETKKCFLKNAKAANALDTSEEHFISGAHKCY